MQDIFIADALDPPASRFAGTNALITAAQVGDIVRVRAIVAAGANVDDVNEYVS